MSDVADPGSWDEIARRLARAPSYWLATSDAERGPHIAPTWGVVQGGSLYLFTERSTRKARNVARDPRVAVHLGDAEDVVIVHGVLVDVGDPREHGAVLDALDVKYDGPGEAQYLPSAPGATYDVLFRLDAQRALMWSLEDFDGSQRRWSAGDG